VASAAPVTSAALASTPASDRWTLTILHTNDVHSRFDPVRSGDVELGGVLRRKAAIDAVRRERGEDHVLLVDAGDFTIGTVW
jgi:5'-nucleotidase